LLTRHLCFASPSRTTGLLTLTASQFEILQSLFFDIGGVQYELTPNAQIWPRGLNTSIGGTEGNIYLVVSDLGSPSGKGLDFISRCSHFCCALSQGLGGTNHFCIDGFTFLQRFYSVFDATNSQVGLATTPFTDAETN
jgi:hypothetical protein